MFLQIFLLPFVPSAALAQSAATITLNPSVRYQTMNGWEATAQVGATGGWSESGLGGSSFCPSLVGSDYMNQVCPNYNFFKDQLFESAVNDLGINRLRLEIPPSIENTVDHWQKFVNGQVSESDYSHLSRAELVDDNNPNRLADTANLHNPDSINANGFKWGELDHSINTIVLPMRQKLQARSEQLYLNVNYVDFRTCSKAECYEHYNYPKDYAEFVLATYQHMQSKYGFTPNAWEIMLEPDNTSWSGTLMGKAMYETAVKLRANGFTPDFIVPSVTNMGNLFTWWGGIKSGIKTQGSLTDAQVDQFLRDNMAEFSYHRYGTDDALLAQIAAEATKYGMGSGMLEHIASDYNNLHKDIKIANNTGWQQFVLAGPAAWGTSDNGAAYYYQPSTSSQMTMTSFAKFFRQYFKYIRRGAVRINVTSSSGTFDPVAFTNTDGKTVVVVKATGGGSFTVNGLPNGTYGIYYTTSSQYNVTPADVSVTNGSATASIPTAGVITLYAKTGSTPTPTAMPTQILTPTPSCGFLGDINCSGKVDTADLLILLGNFGKSGVGDINTSGKVDSADLLILLGNFGK